MVVLPRSYSRQTGATSLETRDRHVGQGLRAGLGQQPLVRRVEVGEEEVDGDRDARILGVRGAHELDHALDLVRLQRHAHAAVGRDPLAHADAVRAPHVGPRLGPVQVVQADCG